MSVRLPSRSPTVEANEISTANYEPLKEEVLRSVAGKLRSEGITTMIPQDLDIAYNEGWHGVTQHIIQGKPLTSLAGLLYTITHRRALDIYRAKHEARRVDMDLEQEGVEIDIAEQLDDQDKLTRLLGRLKDRLNDKERRGVTLCALHGYKRPEAADILGIDRVVFERIMDGATKKMAGIVASIEARGCGDEEWSRLMLAYAHGLLSEDGRDFERAQAHLEGPEACDACRRYVRGLRGLAAVMPPLLPPGLLIGGHEATILAHLYKLFGTGHATATGASAALPGSGAGVATGAAIGGGTAIKTAVIVGATALTVAAGTAVFGGHRHHHPRPGAANPQAAVSRPRSQNLFTFARLGSNPFRETTPGARPAPHHHRAPAPSHATKLTRQQEAPPEFDFEKPRQRATTSSPVRSNAAATSVSHPLPHVKKPPSEFNWEHLRK